MHDDRRPAGHDDGSAAPDGKMLPAGMGEAGPSQRDLAAEQVTIESGLPPEISQTILKGEIESARRGLFVGLTVILIGVVLLVLGVTASVDITFARGDSNGRLVTGAVGIVIALIGAGIIYWTRYSVTTTAARRDDGRGENG